MCLGVLPPAVKHFFPLFSGFPAKGAGRRARRRGLSAYGGRALPRSGRKAMRPEAVPSPARKRRPPPRGELHGRAAGRAGASCSRTKKSEQKTPSSLASLLSLITTPGHAAPSTAPGRKVILTLRHGIGGPGGRAVPLHITSGISRSPAALPGNRKRRQEIPYFCASLRRSIGQKQRRKKKK